MLRRTASAIDYEKAFIAANLDPTTMLGKRKPTYAYGSRKFKKQPFARNPGAFGAGYDPKAVARRKAPPGAEKKYHDFGRDSTQMNNAATGTNAAYSTIETLNGIAQGDAMSQRNGNKITVTGLTVRFQCGIDRNSDAAWNTVVTSDSQFRFIIYVDTQFNGAGPAYDDFFQTAPNNLSQEFAFNKLENTGRFKILCDKFVTVPNQSMLYNGATYHSSGGTRFFKKHFKLNLPIMYGDGTANTAAIRTNNIGIFALCNAQTHRTWAFRSRLRYLDY